MGRECHASRCGKLAEMQGEIGDEKLLACRVRCPSLQTNFDDRCTVCRTCLMSDRCDHSVTPLQCDVKYARKTVSASRGKCPSLPTDFVQSCTACSEEVGNDKLNLSATPLQCERGRGEKLFRTLEQSAFHYRRI